MRFGYFAQFWKFGQLRVTQVLSQEKVRVSVSEWIDVRGAIDMSTNEQHNPSEPSRLSNFWDKRNMDLSKLYAAEGIQPIFCSTVLLLCV